MPLCRRGGGQGWSFFVKTLSPPSIRRLVAYAVRAPSWGPAKDGSRPASGLEAFSHYLTRVAAPLVRGQGLDH